jgi:predicted flap endonuclease-1-like 5' DNA nuclease
MGLVFHFAEIAVLLAIAYAAGWGIGYGLHWLLGQPQPVAVIPPERLAAVTGVAPASEAPPAEAPAIAPSIAEAASAPPPPASPGLEISPEALAALEAPARAAPPAVHMTPLTPAVEPTAVPAATVAEAVVREPAELTPVAVPAGPPPLQPASRPGRAWAGQRKGREAEQFEPPVVVPAAPVPETVAVAPAPVPEPIVEAPPMPVVPPRPLRDDAEAMRSIEAIGNPSVAAPVADAQAAVNAAQAAVEQMLARSIINPPRPEGDVQGAQGKPAGLPRPRDGVRDDLRRIAGIGPLDVNVLNNLGIFHFDQIAALTEREVLWLENHAFQAGRIGREGWQEQASTLAEGGRERLRTLN